MTIKNALKKLSKVGKVEIYGGKAQTVLNNYVISFQSNGGWNEDHSAICFKAQSVNDPNEIESGYHGGNFFDNLTQAIKYVQR